MGVVRLSDRVQRELTYLSYPSREWTPPPHWDAARVLDVLIGGAGQGELTSGLMLEPIANIRIVDRDARGQEEPGTGLLVGAHHILPSTTSRKR